MSANNQVSQPPLTSPLLDKNGHLNRAWSAWFRDIYKRVAFKGGNAIDDIENSLGDVKNEFSSIKDDFIQTSGSLEKHEQLENAHGANGEIVGFRDTADIYRYGLVKQSRALQSLQLSTVKITLDDIEEAPEIYGAVHQQTIVSIINTQKSAINKLSNDLNVASEKINVLIANLKKSGIMHDQ